MKNKKLYQVVLWVKDEDGNATQVEQPEWVVETSKDRVKAKALKDRLEDDLNWQVSIMKEVDFRYENF